MTHSGICDCGSDAINCDCGLCISHCRCKKTDAFLRHFESKQHHPRLKFVFFLDKEDPELWTAAIEDGCDFEYGIGKTTAEALLDCLSKNKNRIEEALLLQTDMAYHYREYK